MKPINAQIIHLLKSQRGRSFTANQIVRRTGLSFTTVRNNLNAARDQGLVERDLAMGSNGHTIYDWYWCGD